MSFKGSEEYLDQFNRADGIEGNVWLDEHGLVCVAWDGTNGTVDKYPSVWLRDNCQCPDCFDRSSRQRKLLLGKLDSEIVIVIGNLFFLHSRSITCEG